MELTLSAPAKLNLFLDITGKRNDGYHLISTVMQSVDLCDEVTVIIEDNDLPITIECTDKDIPTDERNTAHKAARLFMEHIGKPACGVSIKIKKVIPSQAGMAGGSTDAAAVLKALNILTGASLPMETLCDIAEKVGADVPFCLYGGTMKAGGIGTELSPLPDMPGCIFVVAKPDVRVSTPEAYRLSDERGYDFTASPDRVINGIYSGSIEETAKGLYNKFEDVLRLPEIEEIKSMMLSCGALGALMTGSGSAVFGIFTDRPSAEKCFAGLSGICTAFISQCCHAG